MSRSYDKERYLQRKQASCCVICGKPNESSKTSCAACRNKQQSKKWYKANKAEHAEKMRLRQQAAYVLITGYKLEHGCFRCGYRKSARSLHFHHTDASLKENTVSRLAGQGASTTRILQEMQKCVVVCANCHGEIHEQEQSVIV